MRALQKVLSLMLCACMLLSFAPGVVSANAEEAKDTEFCNSDGVAIGDLWYYAANVSKTAHVYRHSLVSHEEHAEGCHSVWEDSEEITDYDVDQMVFFNGMLYLSVGNVIRACDPDAGIDKVFFKTQNKIDRFAMTGNTMYYLTDSKLYSYNMVSKRSSLLLQGISVLHFWLEDASTLSYMTDEEWIHQLTLTTGKLVTVKNNASSLGNPLVKSSDARGASLMAIQEIFIPGQHWNHKLGEHSKPNETTPEACSGCHGNHNEVYDGYCNGTCTCNSFNGSIQCDGYALKVGNDCFDSNPAGWTQIFSQDSVDSLKAGDIVRYHTYWKNGKRQGGHTILVTEVSGDTVKCTECNWTNTDFCVISWGRSIAKSTLKSDGFHYILSAPGTPSGYVDHNPVIYLEQPTVTLGNKVSVTGWAYDPDDPNASLRIDFYLDGQDESKTPLGSAYTGEYRPDVPENGILCGPNQGFAKTIDTGVSGTHTLYAYVINIGEGDPFVLADNVPILTLEKYSGWKELDGHWYYFHNDGTVHTGWLDDNGYWYYMKANGQMVLGWYQVGDYWYYFNESPSAEKPEGMMLTGWLTAAGSWFYLAEDGHMVTDWQQIDGHWYYFNNKGYMQVGWLEINGDWYYLDEDSGQMVTGWIKMEGNWYYFNEVEQASDPIGRMATGWRRIDGSWFYFDEKGHMMTGWVQVNGEWYYLDENGKMVTGWLEDNNAYYYLVADGAMLHGDAEIDGHTFHFADSGAVTVPGKPVLQALTDNITAYEPISFSWIPTVNTTDFLVRIEQQTGDESWQAYRTESVSVNDYESAFPAGQYRVRIEAINGYLPTTAGALYCTPGDWTLFAVADSGAAGHEHPLTEHAAVSPTCEAAGNRRYWSCAVCGKYYTDPEGINEIAAESWVLAPLGHEWAAPSYEWSDNYESCTATAVCKHDAAHIKSETVDASSEVIPSGCTEVGSKTFTAVFSDPAFETQTTSVVIQPLGHSYHLAEWIWTDFTNASAVFVCERDSSHALTIEAKITSVRTEPSCTEAGSILYTATVLFETVEYTDTKVQTLDAVDHFAAVPVRENDVAPTCTQSGGYDTVIYCAICKTELNRIHTVLEALGHVWDDGVFDTEPTCTDSGTIIYTCMICGETYSETVSAVGHSPGEPVQENTLAPTCTQEGGYDMVVYCAVCHAELERQHFRVDAAGHTPGAAVEENRVSPTCTENGGFDTLTYCTVCGAELSRAHTNLSALGHVWDDGVIAPAPSCTSDGVKTYTCQRCGETKTEAIAATGHTAGEAKKENELAATCTTAGGYDMVIRCTICKAILYTEHFEIAALGHDYQAAAAAPTCTEGGYTTYTCSRCGDSYVADETAALGHDWNEPEYVWADDYSTVTATRICKNDASHLETETVNTTSEVTKEATYDEEGEIVYTATFENTAFATQTKVVATPKLEKPDDPTPGLPCDGGEDCPGNIFTDMPAKGHWAHDAIDWAIVAGITSGTSAATFSPNQGCTRSQVVTFLWRAAGEPEPETTNNPFEDVKEGTWYYKAVLWAAETGVTAGTSATTFSPDATCTRAQIVTFLWRYEGSPEATTSNNPFTDVPVGTWYTKAILWASETGVTAGTSATTFSPNATCTRAQIVTFLFRDLNS